MAGGEISGAGETGTGVGLSAGGRKGRLVMRNLVFPTILIVLDVCASIVYGFDGDWRKVIYWGAAAVLTCAVTY